MKTVIDNSMPKKRILLIEDEKHIADGLLLNLELKGYEARIASNGLQGLQEYRDWKPDLIVLDIMLPCIDGLSVLRSIRLEDDILPVLILSAKGDSADKVKGFSYGVDDYLSKPFNLEEFLLRVERLLIRANRNSGGAVKNAAPPPQVQTYSFGRNRIDFGTATAYGRGGEVQLTEQEIKLLKLFISNRGVPISRNELLEIGWGYPRGTKTRTLDNFMVRLRKYFEENPRKPKYFKGVRSVGYIFDPDPE